MKPNQFLALAAIAVGGVFSSFAQTWTQQTNAPNTIAGITASAYGSKLAAIDGHWFNVIWVSTNAGLTWTSNNIPGVPASGLIEPVAMSANGEKMAAVALFASAIYTSTNYGATWISNSVPAEPWFRIASSADGTRLVALGGGLIGTAPIFVSTDSGQTWMQANAPVTNWVSVVSSANGSNWVAAVELSPPGGLIYSSTNCGLDWTLMTGAPNLQYLSLASSADGTKLLAAAGNGTVYTSTNSGAAWVSNAVPSESWIWVASSADGRTLAAVSIFNTLGGPGYIYTSTNSGTTWVSNSVPSQNWAGITSSADGGTLLAAVFVSGGGLYISQNVPAPQLNLTPSSATVTVSWVVPSTNFVLQQSFDLVGWSDVTNEPVLNLTNLQNEVTLPLSADSSFYRLKTP